MGLTFVQVSTETNGGVATSVAAAFPSNTTAGSLLLCHGLSTVTGTFSVTDSLGNTWTGIGTPTSSGNISQVFYAVNASSGADTVTFHNTGSGTITIFLAEYTGQATGATPIAQVLGDNSWSEVGTGTVAFGSVTTVFTNEGLILFGRSGAGGTTLTTQDGSTVRSLANSTVMLQDRNVSAAGTYSSAFSTSFSGDSGSATFFSVKTPTSVGTSPASWVNRHRKFINKR